LTTGESRAECSVDLSNTTEPIHPFIFGQFIEHLGRCIYGGIWAEMLEDRKFFFPITAKYGPYAKLQDTDFPVVGASPWQILGGAEGVSMLTDAPFVGEHSPRLKAGVAIVQHDLGVVGDRACDGYLWAKPDSGRAEIVVTLRWGTAEADKASVRLQLTSKDFERLSFRLTPRATLARGASLEIRVLEGVAVLGAVSLMPEDNVRGLRKDTLALLKRLRGTIYRWPGGNFVSGYEWRDGVGDRDRRPPRRNPAWTGIEHNDFGTDEFIDFCKEVGAEPMIAVNTGFGDAHSAGQWVEYCNGGADSPAGGARASNGHEAPYGVTYWCVGNEMFGPWQLGFMQISQYVLKHNQVAEAMRRVDSSVQLVAVGDLQTINRDHDPEQVKVGKAWSERMLEACADHSDFISEHFYEGDLPWSDRGRAPLLEHVGSIKAAIRMRAKGHRELQPRIEALRGRRLPIAMDEWNYWHRGYLYGELGCRYEWRDGLGIAMGLHEFFRNSDIIHMAHYAQTVNVIGAIKTSRIAAAMETTGLVMQLYREHFGALPITLDRQFEPCDVVLALDDERRVLTVGVVNPTPEQFELALDLPVSRVVRWSIEAARDDACNTPEQPSNVEISGPAALASDASWQVPALSCNIFVVTLLTPSE
jgi:alpha-N-arabinofuranosidase